MRPSVSVIVLVYGVEEYIEKCARSLFGQTMEDLEFIIVDDCTPDRSMEILYSVLEDYPRRKDQVKVIHNEVNRGQAYSRRVGVEAATGEYIIHCDSDDWVDPEMYAKMYAKAKDEHLDMVICQKLVVERGQMYVFPDKLGAEDTLGALIRQDILDHLPDKLVTRKAYDAGIIYPVRNMSEDSAILIQLATSCHSFGYLYEPLYYYNYREGSTSHSEYDEGKVCAQKENFDLAIACLEAKGLSRKYKDDIVTLKCCLKAVAQGLPRNIYVGLYPEVNLAFLFNCRFPVKDRLGHLTHLLGIHGISRLFKRKTV